MSIGNIPKNYQLIHIVTCLDSLNINNYLESVSNGNSSVKLLILLLAQQGVEVDVDRYKTDFTHIEIIKSNSRYPLSVARNLILAYREIEYQAWYMFADDDSTFGAYFFDNFISIISGNSLINIKGANASPNDYFLRLPETDRIVTKKDCHLAISVNMVISGRVIAQVGGFDEKLGVGCYYGAGEDNDYFLRCLAVEPFVFCPSLWNYHPMQNQKEICKIPLKKLTARYKSYGRGVVYMLKKHAMRKEALRIVVRGYSGAVVSLFTLNFKMCFVYFLAANERLSTFIKK